MFADRCLTCTLPCPVRTLSSPFSGLPSFVAPPLPRTSLTFSPRVRTGSHGATMEVFILLLSIAAGHTPCPSVRFEEGSLLRQRHARLRFENRAGDKLETAYNANMPAAHHRKEAVFLREKDAAIHVGHQRFDLLGPVGPPCLELQAFGAKES